MVVSRLVGVPVRLLAMRGKARGLWPVMAIAAISVATVWLVYAVWRSPHRNDLATFGSYVAAVAVVAAAMITRAWETRAKRPGNEIGVAELDQLADLLSRVVNDQWTRAATDRGLMRSEPIPVRWRRSSLAIAGPVTAAVSSRRFLPVPGLSVVNQQRLRGGQISDLHAVYGGLGSGRLVIVGAAGSGKSGAAVLLVLAALKHREQLSNTERPPVPVPVMFTMHEWDPRAQSVYSWLVVRLQQTYPLLAGKDGARKAAGLLAAGRIAVILDGLDEIPEELRPVALQALSQQAAFRLVVLTRSAEMAAAAARGPLEDAAALELQDIDAVTAARYLTRIQLHPAPPRWRELTDRLRNAPDSPLAQALSSPLTLTLVRDTYRDGNSVGELLDFCDAAGRHVTGEAIVDHLLDRVLPAAYVTRPGGQSRRYDLKAAERTLLYLAAQMNRDGTRDLPWWGIRDWVPAAPRAITSGLVAGAGIGLAAGFAVRPAFGLIAGLTGALSIGLFARFRDGPSTLMGPRSVRQVFHPASVPAGLVAGLVAACLAGLAVGLPVGLAAGLPGGLAAGLAFGFAAGLAVWLFGIFSVRTADDTATQTPLVSWRSSRVAGLLAGLLGGLTAGLAFGLAGGLEGALAVGLAAGLGIGFAVWRAAIFVIGRVAGLVAGVAIGLAVGVVVGLTGGPAVGLRTGLAAGLAAGLVLGPGAGLMYTRTWSVTLAFAQLTIHRRTPIRLMRFLEDARQRNVLRTVGPVYQFRHARLQDRLAEQAIKTRKNPGRSPATGAD
jgi:hypothetical protein